MTGLVRNAAIAMACLLVASVALAGVPSPTTSVIGAPHISLVGFNAAGSPGFGVTVAGQQADSTENQAKLWITVNDLASAPVPGSNVTLDFSNCTGDLAIGATQSYHGETVGCAGMTVSNYTNAQGVVTFVVIGGRLGNVAHANGCCRIYADGVLLGTIGAAEFDQNDSGGVQLNDISFVWTDYFSLTNPDRSDFNGSGSVQLNDMAYEWTCYFSLLSTSSAAVSCP